MKIPLSNSIHIHIFFSIPQIPIHFTLFFRLIHLYTYTFGIFFKIFAFRISVSENSLIITRFEPQFDLVISCCSNFNHRSSSFNEVYLHFDDQFMFRYSSRKFHYLIRWYIEIRSIERNTYSYEFTSGVLIIHRI